VVAEGVETREQLEFLRRHGCDHIQGFIFGRPRSAMDFLAFLDGLGKPGPTGQEADRATA
jgi:EAL domain-containing protein (putative c-di-GMP-specific phosphodiesterase class I)